MKGLLDSVVEKIKPLLRGCQVKESDGGYVVSCKRGRYTVGFRPEHVGDSEVVFASIQMAQDDDGFNAVVMTRFQNMVPLTVPNIGWRTDRGYDHQWRMDEAANEIVQILIKAQPS